MDTEKKDVTFRHVPDWVTGAKANASTAELRLWKALEEVDDPEYPISVIDMGLIYNIHLQSGCATIDLTFTSMGCPCMDYILHDIRQRILAEPTVNEVELKIVWDPPWTVRQMTPAALTRLQAWGIGT